MHWQTPTATHMCAATKHASNQASNQHSTSRTALSPPQRASSPHAGAAACSAGRPPHHHIPGCVCCCWEGCAHPRNSRADRLPLLPLLLPTQGARAPSAACHPLQHCQRQRRQLHRRHHHHASPLLLHPCCQTCHHLPPRIFPSCRGNRHHGASCRLLPLQPRSLHSCVCRGSAQGPARPLLLLPLGLLRRTCRSAAAPAGCLWQQQQQTHRPSLLLRQRRRQACCRRWQLTGARACCPGRRHCEALGCWPAPCRCSCLRDVCLTLPLIAGAGSARHRRCTVSWDLRGTQVWGQEEGEGDRTATGAGWMRHVNCCAAN